MNQFVYSFCMMLLHSLWQAAALLLVYKAVSRLITGNSTEKSRLLFVIILSQLVLSTITFFTCFSGSPVLNGANSVVVLANEYFPARIFQYITPWLFTLYLAVISFKTLKTIYSWYLFKKVYKTGLQKPLVDLKIFTELNAVQFGIRRKVSLFFSNNISTPLTFGFLKPVILLPVALVNQLSLPQTETLIIHELNHIRSNDYLQNWMVLFAETIFFFNPFITRICTAIKLEREKKCDLAVLHFKYDPALYAQTLLLAEKTKQAIPAFQLAAVSSGQQLLKRIEFLVNNQDQRNPKKGIIFSWLLITGLLFAMGLYSLKFPGRADNSNYHTVLKNELALTPPVPITAAEKVAVNNEQITLNIKEVSNDRIAVKTELHKQLVKIKLPGIKLQQPVQTDNAGINLIPVKFDEKIPARQIIIEEQQSGSNAAEIKVYTMIFVNGKWVIQPGWSALAADIPVDITRDSSLKTGLKISFSKEQ